jgi:ABC-type amino acid transport substrate-binding protein
MQSSQFVALSVKRSLIVIFASAFLATVSLLATQKAQAPAPSSTLDRIRQANTFRVGYYADAGPLSYQDDSGRPAGYAIELCQQIANDLKAELNLPTMTVEFVLVTGVNRYALLQQHTLDLLCGPSVETFSRRKEVSFSLPIFMGGVGALLRADAPAQIRETLSGHEPPMRPQLRGAVGLALHKRTFSAVPGTTTMPWLNAKLNEFKIDATVVPVENYRIGRQRVLDRTVDVLFGEQSLLLDLKKNSPSSKDLIVLDRRFTYEALGFALARDEDDFRLLVDESLSRLSRSGQTQSLYRKYFGEPDDNALAFFRLNTVPE